MTTSLLSAVVPTPLRVGDAGLTVFGPPNGNPSPETIARCKSARHAAFIVKACNSHGALVEFVENLRALSEAGQDDEVCAEVRGVHCAKLLARVLGK
jgi:hypothetical protein